MTLPLTTVDNRTDSATMKQRAPLETSTAYMLAAIPAMLGIAGVHRFYMGQTQTGLLYVFTWGLFGFGTVRDLINMHELVAEYNNQADVQLPKTALSRGAQVDVKTPCRYCGVPIKQSENTCNSCGGY